VPHPITAVVLDVGETLVDETRAWTVWAKHLGVPTLTFFAALGAILARGGSHREVLELFRPGIDVDAEAEALGVAGKSDLLSLDDLYPDAVACLTELRAAGYVVGLAANQPAPAAAVLSAIGVPLDLVATSEGWGVAKPSPAFFERIVAELELPADSIAYVGDRLDNDVRPARAAGMVSVWIRRGPWAWIQGGRSAPPEADVVVDDLRVLASALADAGFPAGRG
jgi:FMN phosphatase YigB (HAD superfamily)